MFVKPNNEGSKQRILKTWFYYILTYILEWRSGSNQVNNTVEPLYKEVLGTMKITLLYQVSRYIRVKKTTKKYKELGPAKLPCYIKRVLLYPTSL